MKRTFALLAIVSSILAACGASPNLGTSSARKAEQLEPVEQLEPAEQAVSAEAIPVDAYDPGF